eukprot:2145582-Prymnesium_polylepis.2
MCSTFFAFVTIEGGGSAPTVASRPLGGSLAPASKVKLFAITEASSLFVLRSAGKLAWSAVPVTPMVRMSVNPMSPKAALRYWMPVSIGPSTSTPPAARMMHIGLP